MGGNARHMKHLYENPSITFGEIKKIFQKINDGKMLVTEKIDGQNISLSYSVTEGRVKAARNNKHLSEGGISIDNVDKLVENINFQKSLSEALLSFEETIKNIGENLYFVALNNIYNNIVHKHIHYTQIILYLKLYVILYTNIYITYKYIL
jgi:hypothetical protein